MESVEKDCGAFGIDAVAREGGDEQRDRDLDGLGVFDGREVEFDGLRWGGFGCRASSSGCGRCGFDQKKAGFEQMFVPSVEMGVKVAEGGRYEGWGLASFSVDFDVATGSKGHLRLLEGG